MRKHSYGCRTHPREEISPNLGEFSPCATRQKEHLPNSALLEMAVTTRRFHGGCRLCSRGWFRLDREYRGTEGVRIRGEKNNGDLENNVKSHEISPITENLKYKVPRI